MSDLSVIPEVKAFRQRDDLLFGYPYRVAVILIAITALLVLHWKMWTAAAVFFACWAITGKALAAYDPHWCELLPKFTSLPRIIAP